jgi:hypothetical protein
MKFIAPNNEETPAKCKLKIAKSTEPPECDCIPAKGGYTVQPVKNLYRYFPLLSMSKNIDSLKKIKF